MHAMPGNFCSATATAAAVQPLCHRCAQEQDSNLPTSPSRNERKNKLRGDEVLVWYGIKEVDGVPGSCTLYRGRVESRGGTKVHMRGSKRKVLCSGY